MQHPCAGCFTLFATHFGRLSELSTIYPNVRVKHLKVDTTGGKMRCTWQLEDGSSDAVHYGLMLATSLGIDQQVILCSAYGASKLRMTRTDALLGRREPLDGMQVISAAQTVVDKLDQQEMQRQEHATTAQHQQLREIYHLSHQVNTGLERCRTS